MNRDKMLDKIFMSTALEFSKMSTCKRKNVGAILVKNKRIISTGFNGSPSKIIHCVDYFEGRTPSMEEHLEFSSRYELHAEQNVLIECMKNCINPEGADLYLTLSPCNSCVKLIIAAGIKNVYYDELYDRETSGLEVLKAKNIGVYQFNGDF